MVEADIEAAAYIYRECIGARSGSGITDPTGPEPSENKLWKLFETPTKPSLKIA